MSTITNTFSVDKIKAAAITAAQKVAANMAEGFVGHFNRLVPVDTGAMRASLDVVPSDDGLSFTITVDPVSPEGVRYAAYVEFGHHMPDGRYIPPNPAFRVSLEFTAADFPAYISAVTSFQ